LYQEPTNITVEEKDDATEYFLHEQNMLSKIDEIEKAALEQEVDDNEIADALKSFATNKSPGIDGFTTEFYNFFWPKIKELVCNSLKYGLQTGQLSIDQHRGILSLIPKKGKDTKILKNWHPLTLLTTDYKILAKVMATRLQRVLTDLISTDQSGGIKGRSTYNNIRSVVDLMYLYKGTKHSWFISLC
jgi:hypothetical protein